MQFLWRLLLNYHSNISRQKTSLQHKSNNFFLSVVAFAGKYTFAISSDDSSELWLSSNESPSNVKLIAWVGNRTLLSGAFHTKIAQFTKYKTQLSRPVFLHKGQKYFIEVLHKQARLEDHVLVGWKIPGLNNFRHLSGKSISLFVDDKETPKDVIAYGQFIPQDLPSHSHNRISSIKLDHDVFKFGSDDPRDKNHSAKFVDERDIVNLFPSCSYNPSYLVDFKLNRYDGVTLIHDTAVYPADNTELTHMKQYDSCVLRRRSDSHGNRLASLSPTLKSNLSLYENGGIAVFRQGKVYLPLSFAKSAKEREQAVEQLLEMQMDISDIKRQSEEVEDTTESSETVNTPSVLHFLSQEDKEKVFEMKKKAKRKDVETTKRSTLTKTQNDSENKENMKIKRKKAREDLRVKSKDENAHDTKTDARDQASRDFTREPNQMASNGEGIVIGTQRRLFSHKDRDNVAAHNSYNHRDVSSTKTNSLKENANLEFSSSRRGRIQFYPVDVQDDQLTRMNSAREFVRKIANAVQRYNHRVNARALAQAVYRRFGVKLKIPNLFRVPEYNDWIFHQNNTKCSSDGNLLLNTDVSIPELSPAHTI